MNRRLAAVLIGLVVLLASCASVPVYAPGLGAGVETAIDAGLHVQRGPEGSPLQVTEREGLKLGGHAYDTVGCLRAAYVRPGVAPSVVAHEIGHLMGLQHADDETNLMHPKAPTDHGPLTAKQRRRSKLNRAALRACMELLQ